MSVFGGASNYGQQGQARTPNFTGAAYNSARIQAMNQARRDREKQQNIQGAVGLAGSLRQGGMLEGAVPAFKAAYAGAPAVGAAAAPAAGATTGALGGLGTGAAGGAAIPGAAFGMGAGAGAAGAAGAGAAGAGAAGAGAAGAAGGGLAAGAGAALASNPIGWAALAALAAYSLFG